MRRNTPKGTFLTDFSSEADTLRLTAWIFGGTWARSDLAPFPRLAHTLFSPRCWRNGDQLISFIKIHDFRFCAAAVDQFTSIAMRYSHLCRLQSCMLVLAFFVQGHPLSGLRSREIFMRPHFSYRITCLLCSNTTRGTPFLVLDCV